VTPTPEKRAMALVVLARRCPNISDKSLVEVFTRSITADRRALLEELREWNLDKCGDKDLHDEINRRLGEL
jgi:hypothetical protein